LAPFAAASEADRNCSPGYSWPPHLYQEHYKFKRALQKKRVEIQAMALVAGGTATSAPSRGFGAMNLGCALLHENSKNRTDRIACGTKAMPQFAKESRFLAVLGMTGFAAI
jgi:hypothetical protein